jgi:hypothetical protein
VNAKSCCRYRGHHGKKLIAVTIRFDGDKSLVSGSAEEAKVESAIEDKDNRQGCRDSQAISRKWWDNHNKKVSDLILENFSHAFITGKLLLPFLQDKLQTSSTFAMVIISKFSSEESGGKTALISAFSGSKMEGVKLYQ